MRTIVEWLEGPADLQFLVLPCDCCGFGTYADFLQFATENYGDTLPFSANDCTVFGVTRGFADSPSKAFEVSRQDVLLFRPGVIVGWTTTAGEWKQSTFRFKYKQTRFPENAVESKFYGRHKSASASSSSCSIC